MTVIVFYPKMVVKKETFTAGPCNVCQGTEFHKLLQSTLSINQLELDLPDSKIMCCDKCFNLMAEI